MAKMRFGSGRSASLGARLWPWLTLSGLVIVVDQVTKLVIARRFRVGERVPVLPSFDLTLLYNPGAAFSFLANQPGWQRWLFTIVGVVAALFIIALIARHGSQRLFAFALALVLGGALGNVIDRLINGRVIDFLLVYWHTYYWPAFNVADSAITVGALLLVLDELRRVRRA